MQQLRIINKSLPLVETIVLNISPGLGILVLANIANCRI